MNRFSGAIVGSLTPAAIRGEGELAQAGTGLL